MLLTYSVLFCNLARVTPGMWVCKNGILGFKGQSKGVVYQRVSEAVEEMLHHHLTLTIPTFTDVSLSQINQSPCHKALYFKMSHSSWASPSFPRGGPRPCTPAVSKVKHTLPALFSPSAALQESRARDLRLFSTT